MCFTVNAPPSVSPHLLGTNEMSWLLLIGRIEVPRNLFCHRVLEFVGGLLQAMHILRAQSATRGSSDVVAMDLEAANNGLLPMDLAPGRAAANLPAKYLARICDTLDVVPLNPHDTVDTLQFIGGKVRINVGQGVVNLRSVCFRWMLCYVSHRLITCKGVCWTREASCPHSW